MKTFHLTTDLYVLKFLESIFIINLLVPAYTEPIIEMGDIHFCGNCTDTTAGGSIWK